MLKPIETMKPENAQIHGQNHIPEEPQSSSKSIVDRFWDRKPRLLESTTSFASNKVFSESTLPTEETLGYKSKVGFYGGKLRMVGQKMIYDMRGIVSRVDKWGDALLRTYDEHTIKEPLKMLRRHPKWFLKFSKPFEPKRYRGTPSEIAQNAQRLGLSDYYVQDPHGIEIKKPELFTSSRNLYDIYEAEEIGSDDLKSINRFQALQEAAKYIRDIHNNYGAIGELLVNDVLFQGRENNRVTDPVLNIPDIVYNTKKYGHERLKSTELKATDLLDFLVSVGHVESKVSKDENNVKIALQKVLEAYGDTKVIEAVKSLAKRGRLTLAGNTQNLPFTVIHNEARLDVKKDTSTLLRETIINACTQTLSDSSIKL